MTNDIVSALGPCEVTSLSGKRIRLESLWAERPAVLVFLRHFG